MIKIQEIIGHHLQRQRLEEDIETGNVIHAYLFAGIRHLGKMSLARWFALNLLSQGIPADKQDGVQNQIERLVHPDLLILDQLWIEGVCEDWDLIAKTSNVAQQHRAKKPAAKTDTISIDDIRFLQERLYETGAGRWRCCLIRSVERMQDAAASAFLKILEEPPDGLVFILTTQALSSLLPTVVSRTRVIKFHRLAQDELHPLLSEMSDDDVQFISHLAQGAPGTVLALRDNPDLLREQRLMHSNALSFWRSGSLSERMALLNPLQKRGEESRQFLMHLSLALREVFSEVPSSNANALVELVEGFNTNAHRQLLAQKFALTVATQVVSV